VPVVRYEELLTDCHASLAQAVTTLLGEPADSDRVRNTVQRFTFARQSGRKPGSEDAASVVRKGVAGDWKNHFTRDAARVFDRYCGDALIELGYEQDRSWIDRIDDAR
jgi:hypothetical protein